MALKFKKDIIITFDDILVDLKNYEYFGNAELKEALKKLVDLRNNPENNDYKIILMLQAEKIDLPVKNTLISKFFLRNELGEILTDDLELDLLSIEEARKCKDENNKLAKWLRFMGADDECERIKIADGEKIFLQINDVVNKIINSEE